MEENFFVFDGEEDGLKFYKSSDEEFYIIERGDGKFLLYRLSSIDDCYDWTETYHETMQECVNEFERITGGNTDEI